MSHLERIVRDQRRHIANLEAELLDRGLRAPGPEQEPLA